MASVGVLAAIVNVVVLVTVAIVDRVIELVVRNFAVSRLRRNRRAPIVHDSDTWLPNIPRSVFKYHKHPAILLTIVCAALLIGSEIMTELGVDVSNTCSPIKKYAAVITPGDSSNRFTEVELGTSAFFLQSTKFLDGDLTRVPSGFPRSINGAECIVCMNPDRYPDVMSGCTITNGRAYGPGDLSVSILTTSGPFKTVCDEMAETGGSKRKFRGRGDLTFNGVHWSAFIFYIAEDGDLVYLEYSNQEHLPELVAAARESENKPALGPIQSSLRAKKIRCSTNQLNVINFRNATSIYRTIQLENTINPAIFVPEQQMFKNLTTDDVYRAGLSVKIIDDDLLQGEYFEYTTCGKYKWQFLLPIISCVTFIFILFIISMVLATGFDVNQVPYNSRSWFQHSQARRRTSTKTLGPLQRGARYFDNLFDEMVVLEEGRGSSMRIGLRTRDGKIAPMAPPSPSQNSALGSDCASDARLVNENGACGDVVVMNNEVENLEDSNARGTPEAIAAKEYSSRL